MPNLYVAEAGSYVHSQHQRIVVEKDGEILADVPALKVEQVILAGAVHVSTGCLDLLLERGIGLVLLTATGKLKGRLAADRSVNTNLRRAQYARAADPSFCLEVARAIVHAKIQSSRALCLRAARAHPGGELAERAAALGPIMGKVGQAQSTAALRQLEGHAARLAFGALRARLPAGWQFARRARRPPPDPVNILLSVVYTLLVEAVYSAVVMVGLDPYCGYYHVERAGRPALVLDLMEEFRPVLGDALVLTLVNRRAVQARDFRAGDQGRPAVLTDDGYRTVLRAFGERLRTHILVPGTTSRTTYQRLLEVQARRLASAIRGDRERYRAFTVR